MRLGRYLEINNTQCQCEYFVVYRGSLVTYFSHALWSCLSSHYHFLPALLKNNQLIFPMYLSWDVHLIKTQTGPLHYLKSLYSFPGTVDLNVLHDSVCFFFSPAFLSGNMKGCCSEGIWTWLFYIKQCRDHDQPSPESSGFNVFIYKLESILSFIDCL